MVVFLLPSDQAFFDDSRLAKTYCEVIEQYHAINESLSASGQTIELISTTALESL